MDTAAEALLIIVSTVLSIFLVLLGIALIYFIRLLKDIRKVTQKAGNIADSVETAANAFEKAAGPAAVLNALAAIVNRAQKIRKSERGNNGKK